MNIKWQRRRNKNLSSFETVEVMSVRRCAPYCTFHWLVWKRGSELPLGDSETWSISTKAVFDFYFRDNVLRHQIGDLEDQRKVRQLLLFYAMLPQGDLRRGSGILVNCTEKTTKQTNKKTKQKTQQHGSTGRSEGKYEWQNTRTSQRDTAQKICPNLRLIQYSTKQCASVYTHVTRWFRNRTLRDAENWETLHRGKCERKPCFILRFTFTFTFNLIRNKWPWETWGVWWLEGRMGEGGLTSWGTISVMYIYQRV